MLTIGIAAEPLAFEFKPDGGDWQVATLLSRSELQAIYEIPQASGTIAIACRRSDGGVQVEELLATAGDLDDELYGPILPWPQLDCSTSSSATLTQMSGEMLEGGQIYIGNQAFDGQGSPWYFTGDVSPGVYDVVAIGQTQVYILHDRTIVQPTTLPDIDLNNGLDTGTEDIGAVDVVFTIETELTTLHGTQVTIPPTEFGDPVYIPAEELETGDVELVHVIEEPTDPNIASQMFVVPSEQSLNFQELEAPVGAAFGSDDVSTDLSGATLPVGFTELRLEYSTQSTALAVTATSSWIYEHSPSNTLAFDESFPEFSWPVAPSASNHELLAQQRSATLELQTALFDP
jgi:hypothetical protein